MPCSNCGAEVNKRDIFCEECQTPVITEDDIELMPNAMVTMFVNEAQYNPETLQNNPSVIGSDTMPVSADSLSVNEDLSGSEATKPIVTVDTGSFPAKQRKPQKQQKQQNPRKKSSRTVAGIIMTIFCVVVIGFGIFWIIHSLGAEQNNADPGGTVIEIPGVAVPITVETPTPTIQDDTEDPTPDIMPDIISIELFLGDRLYSEFHIMVNETVTLRAVPVPSGIDADISWRSSDPNALTVTQHDQNGREATITSNAAGVVDIIVTLGDYETSYAVFIGGLPLHIQLEDAIKDINEAIWLEIEWTSGRHSGQKVLFTRAAGEQLWIRDDASGNDVARLDFKYEENAFIIDDLESAYTYHFFADATGHVEIAERTETLDFHHFSWHFKTTIIEPEG